jgi:hypothetical protein
MMCSLGLLGRSCVVLRMFLGLLLLLGWPSIAISGGECFITEKYSNLLPYIFPSSVFRPARIPKMGLGFCSRVFPFENCCVPVYDEEIREYYDYLVQTSDLCGSTSTESTRALQYLFCLACSDKQPNYLIEEGIETADDDSGGNYTLYSLVICESLVRLLYPENFDDCGFVVPTARGDDCAGDDTVIPSEYWGSGEEGALNFLNDEAGGKPPLFWDDDEVRYQVIVSPPSFVSSFLMNSVGRSTIPMAIAVTRAQGII